MNGFDYKCPKCGDTDHIDIEVTTLVRLTPDGTDERGDHEWDGKSHCECGACGFAGKVADFEPEA